MSKEILFDVVFNDKTWKGYNLSVKLKNQYRTFFNGSNDDLKPYLRTIKKRETPEEIKARLEASNFLNKSLYQTLKKNPNSLSFKDIKITQLEKSESVDENLRLFFDDRSLQEYIFKVLSDDILIDPNGLVYLSVQDKDVHPKFINSESILYKEKSKGAYQFVVIEKDNGYIAFLDGQVYEFTKLDKESCTEIKTFEGLESGNIEYKGDKYNLEITKGFDFAPFVSVGFIYSIEDKEVYISYFDSALSYFKKLTSAVSEHDISELKQAFPKIFAYEQTCKGSGNLPCNAGFCSTTQKDCTNCGGSGVILSKSGQDIVTIPIPDLTVGEEFVDLSKLYYEAKAPIEILNYQREVIKEHIENAITSVYGKDDIENVNKTATSRLIEVEKSNQALYPYANNIKRVYEVIAKQVSLLKGQTGNEFEFTFPQKLIELNESELIELIKEAKENNLPSSIVQEYNNRLSKTVFKNNKYKAKINEITTKIKPFNDLALSDVLILMTSGRVSQDDIDLNLNFDRFLKEVEAEYLNSQKTIIDASISEVETKIKDKLKAFTPSLTPVFPEVPSL